MSKYHKQVGISSADFFASNDSEKTLDRVGKKTEKQGKQCGK